MYHEVCTINCPLYKNTNALISIRKRVISYQNADSANHVTADVYCDVENNHIIDLTSA